MIKRKTFLASSIAAAVLTVSSAGAAVLQPSNSSGQAQPIFNTPAGATLLYDQTDAAAGNGVPAQNFEVAYDAYDSDAADDFVVPAGGWTVSSFNLGVTSTFTGAVTSQVTVYADAGGLPGAATCSYAAAATNLDGLVATVTLPTTCALGAGTYWVGLAVNLDFAVGGQTFWSNRTTLSNSSAVWRNPGDGFASGCTTFTPLLSCAGIGGGAGPDLLFQVVGALGGGGVPAGPAVDLPTLSQWSALLAAVGLAMFGLLGLRRRARR